MSILRIILGLFIGWIILMVLFLVGMLQLVIAFIRNLVTGVFATGAVGTGTTSIFGKAGTKTGSRDKHDAALDMKRCPACGVFTSGICSNPSCGKVAH